MLSESEMEKALQFFRDRWDEVRQKYLRIVGDHLKQIGAASATDLHRIEQILLVSKNVAAIEREIAAVADLNAQDVRRLLREAAARTYGDYGYLYEQKPFRNNPVMQRVLSAQTKVTLGELYNLSRTTVYSTPYKNAVDKAVMAVQSGMTSYGDAISSVIREVAASGLRVTYASGTTRRLDTAARQNVLDGVRSLNQAIAQKTGQEFGADGVEVSAHFDCADDHVDIQGRQFTLEEFERVNNSLERPIGELNCKHFTFPILIGVSEQAYSDEALAEINANSQERITIDGVTKSRYDWTQEQRRIETAVRYQKDAAVLAKAAGVDTVRREAQANINTLTAQYHKVAEAAGVPERMERMRVAGFKPVRAR